MQKVAEFEQKVAKIAKNNHEDGFSGLSFRKRLRDFGDGHDLQMQKAVPKREVLELLLEITSSWRLRLLTCSLPCRAV